VIKSFKLNGLGCANCAARMQDKIGKLDGVKSATVSFITTKLIIDGDNDKMEKIIESARIIIKKIESDVVMQNM
jgi:copper chaperone CopZ